MAENKIQFTDTNDLTPESEKLLQEEAERAYLKTQDDETFIEELSDTLENEEKTDFFPEELKNKLFSHLEIDSHDLEAQKKIKTAFLGKFCQIIHKNLSAPDQRSVSTVSATPTSAEIKTFISNFKTKIKDEDLKAKLTHILDNLLDEIEIKSDKFIPVTADIDKYSLLLEKMQQQLHKLSGQRREEYSQKIEILKKNFETIKNSEKTESIDTNSIKTSLNTISDENKAYFVEISKASAKILKPTTRGATKEFYTSVHEMKNDLINPQSRLKKMDEELKKIEEIFKDKRENLPAPFKKVQTTITHSLTSIETILTLDNARFTPFDDPQRLALMTETNKLFQNSTNENIQTIIDKNTENLIKIIPASKTLFKSLEKFKIFQDLVKKTQDVQDKLFGSVATVGNPDTYDDAKIAKKELSEKDRINKINNGLNTSLEKFEQSSKTNEIFTDTELHEHFYKKYLFDKVHANPEFQNDIKKAEKDFAALADMNDLTYDKEVLAKEASIADKLDFFKKVIEKLGKENINPSLMDLYEKIEKSEHNPESNLKKLMDKVNELEKTKKELLDTKNTDVLSDKIPVLMQNLETQASDLRKLEYQVFGAKKATDVKKEINKKRKEIDSQIEIDANGNIIPKAGKKLEQYLNSLRQKIDKIKNELKILKENSDKTTDEEEKRKNQNEYKIKYQYLIRIEELLQKKEANMQNFIISGHPEKIEISQYSINSFIDQREQDRFSNNGIRDQFSLSRIIRYFNPKYRAGLKLEAIHRHALSNSLNSRIADILETGFAPEYKYLGPISKLIKHPYERIVEIIFKGHREGAISAINSIEEQSKKAMETDQKKVEKLKEKYPELVGVNEIWDSKDIHRSIKLHLEMIKATEKGDSARVASIESELKSLIRDKEAANKEMQKLISVNLKGKSIEEAIKDIRDKEKTTSEKIDKRTENIYEKFEKVLSEFDSKYYPNPKERYTADKEKWQKVASVIRIPEDFDKDTLKPFFKFLKHHQKNSVYQFQPEDIIILLKMQNANLLNAQNQLSSALDFNRDYQFLKTQNKIKTVRDYLSYRKDHQQAMKT